MPVNDFAAHSEFKGVPLETAENILSRAVTPTDKDFAREAERQRQMTSFKDESGRVIRGKAFDEIFTGNNATEATRRLLRSQNEEGKKLNRIGWSPVTIVNLMPFPLEVNGVIHRRYDLKVPPAPLEPKHKDVPAYSMRTLDRLYWDSKDLGTGMDDVDNFQAVPWTPVELAEDFTREYNDIQKCGGVFFYEGANVPESTSVLREMLKKAAEARNTWCLAKVQEADLEYTNESTHKNITEIHRGAWRILHQVGIVKEEQKPGWLRAVHKSAGQTPELCPGCDKPKAGIICVNCHNVFKPLVAYKEGMIEFGHVSFQKMTDAEYEEAKKIKKEREKRFGRKEEK